MVNETIRKYNRTNIFIINEELWAWAQYRAKTLGYSSTSEYIFDLIKLDKKENLLKQLANKKLGEG
jgi:prophage antirepressor-like protein